MKSFALLVMTASLCIAGSFSHASAQCKALSCEVQTRQELYRCPMHPEVTSDKRDRCPKCNMFLEKVPEEQAPHGHAAMQTSPYPSVR